MQELEEVQAEARHTVTRRVFQAKEENMLSEEGKVQREGTQHVGATRRAVQQATRRRGPVTQYCGSWDEK